LIDREATMSKLTRVLILAALLAAMNLAGLTAVAHAQANDPDGKDARRLASERQVGEPWRHGQVASPEQTAADAALQRVLARERFSIPSQTPAQTTAPAPPEPSGQPSWLLASLGGFAAGLVLAGGLAVLAARQAGRRARVGHVA
jgi:CHASE1-domain containing sensor protein